MCVQLGIGRKDSRYTLYEGMACAEVLVRKCQRKGQEKEKEETFVMRFVRDSMSRSS